MTHRPDPLALLTLPGGGPALRREGEALVAPDGQRFQIRGGIVRMLGEVGEPLAAELTAQRQARASYLDARLLLTCHERTVADFAAELLGEAQGPILDAGCGVGLLGRLWPGRGLFGLDASFDLLEEADAGYCARIHGDAERLPFAAATFGAVVALNMLHHVPDPARAVREFGRVLRPGGVLVTVDPRRVAPIELVKRLLRRRDPRYAPSHRAFTPGEYRRLFETAGLDVEVLRPLGLVTLLAGGGLDGLGVLRRVPGTGALAATLTAGFERLDATLARVPAIARGGLNLYVRARR